jgi:hypothetical protein
VVQTVEDVARTAERRRVERAARRSPQQSTVEKLSECVSTSTTSPPGTARS